MSLAIIPLSGREFAAFASHSGLHVTFNYKLNLADIPDSAKSVDVWIPLPVEDDFQKLLRYEVNSELPYNLVVDLEYGNRIIHFKTGGTVPPKLDVAIAFDLIRYEQDGLSKRSGESSTATWDVPADPGLSRYLLPDMLIPIDGPVEVEAKQVVSDSMSSYQKVAALYHHLVETMKYDKSIDGWGNGDARYACEIRAGNCTDIHSLFIGMVRSLDIPSRFVIGFPLPDAPYLPGGLVTTQIAGYHCWAEFYLNDYGWVPVDISEAIKHPEKKEYYFGRVDSRRVAFTIGRDIKIESSDYTHQLNYFVYPYVLVDGQVFGNASYSFSSIHRD